MHAPARLLAALTAAAALAILLVIGWQGWQLSDTNPAVFLPRTVVAFAVLLVAFVGPLLVQPFQVRARRTLAIAVGLAATLPALLGVWATSARVPFALGVYEGLHVPAWADRARFWDVQLVLESIDCARWGFDVYQPNNGCLQDPSIYGPGVLWLRWIPGLGADSSWWLGMVGLVISGVAAWWLARQSSGRGQLVLLVSVLGGAWLLLVERGNLDACFIWAAVLAVIVVRRWDRLWIWGLVAALIWLLGTWKYTPFAMGLMLLPVLRLRRGWLVLVSFAVAVVAFLETSWSTVQLSLQASGAMASVEDLVSLGRVGLVARMDGTYAVSTGWGWADGLVLLLVLCAVVWGAVSLRTPRPFLDGLGMLAAAGGALTLASVLVAGFGYAYKAAFLLLALPLVSRASVRDGARWYASMVVLSLIAVGMVVVWNTVLASIAVLIAAGYALGLGGSAVLRSVRA